jgi:hypothetical protein
VQLSSQHSYENNGYVANFAVIEGSGLELLTEIASERQSFPWGVLPSTNARIVEHGDCYVGCDKPHLRAKVPALALSPAIDRTGMVSFVLASSTKSFVVCGQAAKQTYPAGMRPGREYSAT